MPIIRDDVRRLATVEAITNIAPIPDADAIVQAHVRGWTVVVKQGEFREGQLVVYFEVDTALPLTDPRFEFLGARASKTVDDVAYHVLRTAKLRGVYSQGLVMPLADFPELDQGLAVGADVTASLGLGKWEAPIPTGNGQQVGPFLSQYASKTDSERVQNLLDVWETIRAHEWYATEKVDGSSATYVRDADGRVRVMGRNWEIAEGDNTYWNVLARYTELVASLRPGDAVQCELVGPGIQANPLGLFDVRPVVFDVWRDRRVVRRRDWAEVIGQAEQLAAPVRDLPFPATPEEAIAQVDKLRTVVGRPERQAEGVVWHNATGVTLPELGNRSTWKAINNSYLLKHGG